MTPPTAAQFAAAVTSIAAELRAANPATVTAIAAGEYLPACLAGVEWAGERLDRATVAGLCRIEPATVSEYARRARTGARGVFGVFPQPVLAGAGYSAADTWWAGQIATWKTLQETGLLLAWPKPANGGMREKAAQALAEGVSARMFADQAGISRERAARLYREAGAPRRATDRQLAAAIRVLLGKDPRMPIAAVVAALRDAGYRAGDKRVARLIAAIGRPWDAMKPDHPAGWVRAATLARAAHVSPGAVAKQARAGKLTPWARDRWGCLYDPELLAAGGTPADADWVPGGGGEQWIRDPANGELLTEVRSLLAAAGDRAVTVPDVVDAFAGAGREITGKHAGVLLYLA